MSEPKSHHLLPRFYLSGFCDPEIHERENHERDRSRCRVWVHDKEQDRIRERGVKNLSTETHYYSAEMPGGGLDAGPEKALAGLEDRVAPIFRNLRPGWRPSGDERTLLAHFAALIKFRVSGYRPWALRYTEENEAEIRKRVFPSPEALRADLRRHGHPEAEEPETVERIFRDIHSGAYELALTKNHMLERMFSIGAKAARALVQRDWVFGWAPEDTSFITSDDPFVLMDPSLEPPAGYMGDVGFAVTRALALLPLTQKICLVAFGKGGSVHHLKYSKKDVRNINTAQAKHYERWLIARHRPLLERLVG